MKREFKIKTYKRVRKDNNREIFKNITSDEEPLFKSMKVLLIEAQRRQRKLAKNMLLRLVVCNDGGTEIRYDNSVYARERKEIVFWR